MFLASRAISGRLRITHARWFDTLRRRMLPARDGNGKGKQQMSAAYE